MSLVRATHTMTKGYREEEKAKKEGSWGIEHGPYSVRILKNERAFQS